MNCSSWRLRIGLEHFAKRTAVLHREHLHEAVLLAFPIGEERLGLGAAGEDGSLLVHEKGFPTAEAAAEVAVWTYRNGSVRIAQRKLLNNAIDNIYCRLQKVAGLAYGQH